MEKSKPIIIRFAKAYLTGGGLESFIDDLDYALLNKNELVIIRMYISEEDNNVNEEIVGKGKLIKVPLSIKKQQVHLSTDEQRNLQETNKLLKAIFRELIIYNPLLYKIIFKKMLNNRYPKQYGAEVNDAGKKLEWILKKYGGDLLVMHSIGSIDTNEMINVIKSYNIPFVFHNNFSNKRLTNISVREQLKYAECIVGLTDIGVPTRLKRSFVNLSSGIDPNSYHLKMKEKNDQIKEKIIFYPARVTPLKGQADLLKAYQKIKKMGMKAKVIIAGRPESIKYESYLKQLTEELEIAGDVVFLGQISREDVIKWYNEASVLAFPTYHPEGMPTILMEAQAMKIPPVAYNIGGIPQAMINGKTGFIVPKGDIKSFSKKLFLLLNDDKMREDFGENGRKFIINKLSLDDLAKKHLSLYKEIIHKSKNNRISISIDKIDCK